MSAVKELLEKRAKLVNDARAILERHKTAGTLPADDKAHYDRIMGDAMNLTQEVEQRNSFAERQAAAEVRAAAADHSVRAAEILLGDASKGKGGADLVSREIGALKGRLN